MGIIQTKLSKFVQVFLDLLIQEGSVQWLSKVYIIWRVQEAVHACAKYHTINYTQS